MEVEMEKSKKMLQKEMGENKLLIEENETLLKNNQELISLNNTLVRSQRQYEEKWRKLFHALQFYKEFYYKYLELILNNVTGKSQDAQTIERYKEQHSHFELLLQNPEKIINEKKRKEEEAGKLVNVSILDLNDEQIREENRLEHILQTAEKEDFKVYLLKLAKDVNLLCQKRKVTSGLPVFKYKRSVSNPIDYRTETRKIWMENNNRRLNINAIKEASGDNNLLKNMQNMLHYHGTPNQIKSPVFGNKHNGEVEDLGLESPEQIIYHTNYEEEDANLEEIEQK